MGKRKATKYVGVFYKEVRRIGGKRDQKEKSYFIIFKTDGKNKEEHVGYQFRDSMTPSKAAKIRGQRIEHRRKSRKQIRLESEWTFQKLWDKYVDHRKEKNKGTGPNNADVSRYNNYLKDTVGHITPANLKPDDLKPIHEKLSTKADGTQYAVLQMVNRLSTFAKKKQLSTGIGFFIELPKVEAERTEMLTEEQFKTLLEVLRTDGTAVAKLMELGLSSGMRRGEMLKLKWGKVDLENGFITIARDTAKSDKTSRIPINAAAKGVLLSLDQNGEFVFQGLQGRSNNWILIRAKILIAKAGLPDDFRPFHGLRHAFASLLASRGVELYQISKLLTHANVQQTSRYSHLTDKALKDASNVAAEVFNGDL